MTTSIDEAADAALAKLTASKAQPAEDTQVEPAAVEDPEATDPDDGGTVTEDGQAEDPGEAEAAGEQPPTDEVEDEDSPVEGEDDGAPSDDEPTIPEDAYEINDEDTFVVEIDGEEVALTGEELRNGYLRHDDYTRKRQAESAALKEAEARAEQAEQAVAQYESAAEDLEQAKEWVAERQANPPAWIAEIAASSGDAQLASAYVAQGIMHLHNAGLLTDEFAQLLQLGDPKGHVQEAAQQGALDQRLARIEQRLEGDPAPEGEQPADDEAVAALVAEYRAQWDSIVEEEGLEFETPDAEVKLRGELVEYATEHSIDDLEKAWLRMQRDRSRSTAQAAKDKVGSEANDGNAPKPKRGSGAITRSSTPTRRAPTKQPAKTVDEAADRAYKRLVAARG